MSANENGTIRQAIVSALPPETSLHGAIPTRKDVYVPSSHTKALRLECNLVIGARGVGKSFWSAALSSSEIRQMLGGSVTDISLTDVSIGFSESSKLDAYPDADTFSSLIVKNFDPYDVWRAVIARWAGKKILAEDIPSTSWVETSEWVKDQPETFARILERANAKSDSVNKMELIVFDALDRSSSDWRTMDTIVRDLLRVILLLKRFTRLHGKVFLREDQFNNRPVATFPDASKLLSNRVELAWAPNDLHGLLWQRLCNGPSPEGESLRTIHTNILNSPPTNIAEDTWLVHRSVTRDMEIQRSLFEAISGKWMGKDHRRGAPYTWSVGHLADGRGRTSPRSFLAAIREAAQDSIERYPEHGIPLHYESIKRGVQKASEIRVKELAEDYPWVTTVMQPLRGITVPCPFNTIKEAWKRLRNHPSDLEFQGSLPPEHVREGWSGVREDLGGLGIFDSMSDGRINMPDLYRVGFGLGRRGGVKPVRGAAMD